ncbi:hypothetical protein HY480_03780 [Candidatus Uhrbacteria bacterium]|nr:hypothetical protein [Candidatus Uhrbacteria bacterium]
MAGKAEQEGQGSSEQGSATIRVKVGMAGQNPKLIDLQKGATAGDAAKAAGFEVAGKDIRVGTEKVKADYVLPGDCLVMVTPRVEAGDE